MLERIVTVGRAAPGPQGFRAPPASSRGARPERPRGLTGACSLDAWVRPGAGGPGVAAPSPGPPPPGSAPRPGFNCRAREPALCGSSRARRWRSGPGPASTRACSRPSAAGRASLADPSDVSSSSWSRRPPRPRGGARRHAPGRASRPPRVESPRVRPRAGFIEEGSRYTTLPEKCAGRAVPPGPRARAAAARPPGRPLPRPPAVAFGAHPRALACPAPWIGAMGGPRGLLTARQPALESQPQGRGRGHSESAGRHLGRRPLGADAPAAAGLRGLRLGLRRGLRPARRRPRPAPCYPASQRRPQRPLGFLVVAWQLRGWSGASGRRWSYDRRGPGLIALADGKLLAQRHGLDRIDRPRERLSLSAAAPAGRRRLAGAVAPPRPARRARH